MKKLIISAICLLSLAAGVSSYAYYRSHQIVAKNSLAKANVEALTEGESQAEINAKLHYQPSGIPNAHCPIWIVSVTYGMNPSSTCTTGGIYKCKEGKCPHE